MKYKVSIVIPVYGVEKYIERCARSLFEQTLKEIEYIFVNDCTPDNSINILRSVITDYPERKESIRIVGMAQNSGLPAVRKYGVSLATGNYIIGCDSDDYVEKEMYEDMYDLANKFDLDLVQCDIDVVDDTSVLYTLSSKKADLSSSELKRLILDGDISNSLCNKLVRHSIYQNPIIHFPTRNIDEDNATAIQLAHLANRLGYIKKSFYKAYLNRASMSRGFGVDQINKRFDDSYANSQLIVSFLQQHGYAEESKAMIKAKIRPKQILWPAVNGVEGAKRWKSVYPEINWKVVLDKRFPFKIKIKFILVLTYIYPIFNRVRNFK